MRMGELGKLAIQTGILPELDPNVKSVITNKGTYLWDYNT